MKFIHFSGQKTAYKKGRRIDYKKPKIDLQTPKIKSGKFSWRIFVWIVAFLSVGAIYWCFFISDFFLVREILIEGDAEQAIIDEVLSLKGKNIFSIGGKKTEEILKQKQPGIKEIKIVRGIPNTLKVELIERDSALTWESTGQKYLVDSSGVIFKSTDKVKHFLIKDTNNIVPELGKQIIDENFIAFVALLNQEIPLKTDFKITHFEIVETTYQVLVVGENNKKIIFSTMRQPSPQINSFKKIYDEKKNDIKEYIDTRVEGMVYYK